MPDVLLFHEADGGNIQFINGQITTHDGLRSSVYLSMFGGNERDSGLQPDERLQWWGNFDEPAASRRYRSQTQHLLRSLPAVTANLLKLEDAVLADLAWFTEDKYATAVSVRVTMPKRNWVRVEPRITIDDKVFSFEFTEGWGERTTPPS